jgi:hypothetical protein
MFDSNPSLEREAQSSDVESRCTEASQEEHNSQQDETTEDLFARGPQGEPSRAAQSIYRFVTVEGWNLQETAKVYGLQVGKVEQICREVQAWIDAIEPTLELGRARAEKRTIARLEFLYSEATEAWRESKKDQLMRKCPAKELTGGTVTTFTRNGQPSLLVAAGKLAVMLGRFELSCVAQRERSMANGPELRDRSRRDEHPLVRDCSDSLGEQGAVAMGKTAPSGANASSQTVIDDEDGVAPGPTSQGSRPVHNRNAGGGRGAEDRESEIGGEKSENRPKPR